MGGDAVARKGHHTKSRFDEGVSCLRNNQWTATYTGREYREGLWGREKNLKVSMEQQW